MGEVALALQVASALFNMYQTVQEGKAAETYYNYLAKQQEAQAEAVMEQAHRSTVEFHEDVRRFKAGQAASAAAMGMAGSQSAIELLSDTARQSALDEAAIKYNAELQARALRSQAELYRVSGRYARQAAGINAFSTMIDTAGQVADYWYNWQRTGAAGRAKGG